VPHAVVDFVGRGLARQVRADALGAQRRVVRMYAQRRDQIVQRCDSGPGGRPWISRARADSNAMPARRSQSQTRRPSRRRQARNAPRSRAAPLRCAGACRYR
jgi:hypothetical protein